MRIAFVNQPWGMVLPPVQSGSLSIWTWEVARRLARGHEVHVYEGCKRFKRPRVAPCEGVRYHVLYTGLDEFVLRVRESLARRGFSGRPVPSLGSYYLSYAMQVALDIRRRRCDAVHIHQCSQFLPVIRALNPHAKIFLHMNCEWLTQFDPRLIEPRLRHADFILGCSDYIANLIREGYPRFADRCYTVPNGVHVEQFSPPAGAAPKTPGRRKRLVFVGRVSPEKGVHDLLDAFALVVKRYPEVELDIIGPQWMLPAEFIVDLSRDPLVTGLKKHYEGNYIERLRQSIPPEAAGKVRFAGKFDYGELAAHYHGADILINPSLSESFGMTVVEAMACGKPVIVTRTGGMQQTVEHGANGLVVPPADPKALAEAILYLLEHEELWEGMGRVGRKRAVELFSWETVVAKWLGCLEKKPAPAYSAASQ